MASSKVLVVAAHPDDEVLGCGATIAKHAARGDEVHVAIMAEGITARQGARDAGAVSEDLQKLQKAAKKANDTLGVASVTFHGFPDNRMDSVPLLEVIKVIEGLIARINPDRVYTHHGGDLNVDHRIVRDAVLTALRPLPGAAARTLLFFEVCSSTDWQAPVDTQWFVPNWHEDVSATLARKLEALGAYEAEMRPWPHARSLKAVEHLARWRGSSVGLEAAEAFMLGRHLA